MQQQARKMRPPEASKTHDIFQPYGLLARPLRSSILRAPDRRIHEIVTALLQAYGIVQP
jgi:hypothetical protein